MAAPRTNLLAAAARGLKNTQSAIPQYEVREAPAVSMATPDGNAQQSSGSFQSAPVMPSPSNSYDEMVRNLASGKTDGFDPAAMRSSYEEKFPLDSGKKKEMSREDWGKLIMLAGINTLAASVPGSTPGSALGQGISAGYNTYSKEESDAQERADRQRRERMALEELILKTADQSGDRVMQREKMGFDRDMALRGLANQDRNFDLQLYDTITDANGKTYRQNKQTGELSPVMTPEGAPLIGATKDPTLDMIMRSVNSQVANSFGQLTPQQALQNTLATMTAINNSRGDVPSGNEPAPLPNIPLPNAPADDGIQVINTPEEAMKLRPGTKFRTPDGRVKVR